MSSGLWQKISPAGGERRLLIALADLVEHGVGSGAFDVFLDGRGAKTSVFFDVCAVFTPIKGLGTPAGND